MALYDDPDDERPAGGPPLPPEDRLWRHPSELGPASRGVPTPAGPPHVAGAALAVAPHRRQTSLRAALTGACVAGALVALGVLMLSRPMAEVDVRRSPGLGAARTSMPSLTTLAAPVASPAPPIQRVVSATDLDPAAGPGRLGVEVIDGRLPAVVVTVEAGGAAARSGILAGDVIVSVNGEPVRNADDLSAALSSTVAGEVVTLVLDRDGLATEATVELG